MEKRSALSAGTMSRLIPLRKPQSNKIRPIACGEVFTRLAARWALSAVNAEGALLKSQFGVGTKGGVEPLVWGLWDDLTQLKEGGLVAIDFVNAFNTISRHAMADSIRKHIPQLWRIAKLLYGEPLTLFVNCDGETHIVPSRTGIRQRPPPCLSVHLIRTDLKTPLDPTSCGPITQTVCGHCLPRTHNRPYASRYLDGEERRIKPQHIHRRHCPFNSHELHQERRGQPTKKPVSKLSSKPQTA